MQGYINYKTVKKPLEWENLLVEIGFGRGDFTVKLAKENPERIILGFEISGVSVEKLLKRIKREGLKNVYCSKIDAYWGFYLLLKDSSVETIYMNYPDPWFKKKHHKRRLTSKENLYIFARKLKDNGEIRIRTDYYPFIEFTLENANELKAFEHSVRELSVKDPLTKYESKWLSMGRTLYELVLRKIWEPEPVKIRELKLIEEMYPVRVEGKKPKLENITGKEFKIGEPVYLKFFKAFEGEKGIVIETLLSENGFVQKFFTEIRRKEDNVYVVDISQYSEVLRTENLQKAVEFVARNAFE